MLYELGCKYGTDKTTHGFLPFYEKNLSKYKNDNINLLEIGVFYGSSLKMWHEYFPKGNIYGMDHFTGLQGNGHTFCDPNKFKKELDHYPRIKLLECNQHHVDDLEKMCQYFSKHNLIFDCIIDDASHLMQDQQQTFGLFWKYIKPGGMYIIEDLHTSLEIGYDVTLSNTTLDMIYYYFNKNKIVSKYIDITNSELIDATIHGIDLFKNNKSITGILFKK